MQDGSIKVYESQQALIALLHFQGKDTAIQSPYGLTDGFALCLANCLSTPNNKSKSSKLAILAPIIDASLVPEKETFNDVIITPAHSIDVQKNGLLFQGNYYSLINPDGTDGNFVDTYFNRLLDIQNRIGQRQIELLKNFGN